MRLGDKTVVFRSPLSLGWVRQRQWAEHRARSVRPVSVRDSAAGQPSAPPRCSVPPPLSVPPLSVPPLSVSPLSVPPLSVPPPSLGKLQNRPLLALRVPRAPARGSWRRCLSFPQTRRGGSPPSPLGAPLLLLGAPPAPPLRAGRGSCPGSIPALGNRAQTLRGSLLRLG